MKIKLQFMKSSPLVWSLSLLVFLLSETGFSSTTITNSTKLSELSAALPPSPSVPITVSGPATITNFSTSFVASAYSYSPSTMRQYRFKIKNMTTGTEVITPTQTSPYFTIPGNLRAWSTSYEISAAAVVDGVDFDFVVAPIVRTSAGIPAINMAATTCGNTLSSFSFVIASTAAPVNPTLYRFKLRLASSPSGPFYYAVSSSRFVTLSEFAGLTLEFNQQYTVSVQYEMSNNGFPATSAYGAECNFSAPTFTSTFTGAPYTICAGQASPLPATSIQGSFGSWSPAFDANNTTTYYFTPTSEGVISASTTVTVTPQLVWYQDFDNDTFGNLAAPLSSCTQPSGYVTNSTDCDDASSAVNPVATEICYNDIDDNCDGIKSEGCATVSVSVNNPGMISNFAISMSGSLFTYDGIFTRGYQFEITNTVTGQVRTLTQNVGPFTRYFQVPGDIRGYNTLYQIRAAAIINGEVLAYAGPTLSVMSGPAPTVKLIASSCGATFATNINSTIVTAAAFNAVSYEFRMRPVSTMVTHVQAFSPNIYLSFGAFPGVQYATTYEVSVRYAYLNNGMPATSLWGDVCLVTTPGAPPVVLRESLQGDSLESFSAVAYPNPFNDGFQLNVKSNLDSEVSVAVFDMVGRMIESRSSKASHLETLTIGSNYPAGVYNVIVTQGAEKKTVRVIKR